MDDNAPEQEGNEDLEQEESEEDGLSVEGGELMPKKIMALPDGAGDVRRGRPPTNMGRGSQRRRHLEPSVSGAPFFSSEGCRQQEGEQLCF